MDVNREKLYPALKSLDRINKHLELKGITLPKDILVFTDSLWEILYETKKTAAVTKTDRKIGQLIVDEQDAGFDKILLNKYYYVLSNIILLLRENSPLSGDAALEEALEFFRFDSANDYLSSLGGDAIVLNEADEENIENDKRVKYEKERQLEDINFAKRIRDWANVTRKQ
jgi:hypothetical protein